MLKPVLHDIEKKILNELGKPGSDGISETTLASNTGLGIDQVRRGVEWLRHKEFVDAVLTTSTRYTLDENGILASKKGLPEKRLIYLVNLGIHDMDTIRSKLGADFGVAMGIVQKNNWVHIEGKNISLNHPPSFKPINSLIQYLKDKPMMLSEIQYKEDLKSLMRRPKFIKELKEKSMNISLTKQGRTINLDSTGDGIDVEADAPVIHPAKTHPLNDIIGEIRETFVTLGFSEVVGNMSQSGFWNFDALFTPQNHPAREMQDTFYLDSSPYSGVASNKDIAAVSAEHKRHWSSNWSAKESQKAVLRTHTTCVTINHIAKTKPKSARIFSLGRVFRNEKPSYKHLAEFNQVEGVVVGPNVSLRGLMGIQKEFYHKMGMNKVKFWPTFFPYTEPSLQSMVYNETLGKWVELFGMGIFRPQVTRPLGIKERVLAWGGGIERIAMMKYAMSDVRELYANRLSWIRGDGA